MTRKARIAQFIREKKMHSYDEWVEFQKQIPEIRLKKAAKSQTLIQLEGDKGFEDPESWLHNYEAGQRTMLRRALVQAEEGIGVGGILNELRDLPTVSSAIQEMLNQSFNNGDTNGFLRIFKVFDDCYLKQKEKNEEDFDVLKKGVTWKWIARFFDDEWYGTEVPDRSTEESMEFFRQRLKDVD